MELLEGQSWVAGSPKCCRLRWEVHELHVLDAGPRSPGRVAIYSFRTKLRFGVPSKIRGPAGRLERAEKLGDGNARDAVDSQSVCAAVKEHGLALGVVLSERL